MMERSSSYEPHMKYHLIMDMSLGLWIQKHTINSDENITCIQILLKQIVVYKYIDISNVFFKSITICFSYT